MPNLINNTAFLVPKDDSKDRIHVEVGDSKQPDFHPQVKLMRWDNEVNFSARLITDDLQKPIKIKDKLTPIVSTLDDKIIHDIGNVTSNFYPIEPCEEHPEGGYEFEVTLKEKPDTNVISFTLQTKGLDFFYQPIPTDEEKLSFPGDRPLNVQGSYAVYYHDCPKNYEGGKLYRAGKAFHIYRPQVQDTSGNKVWGELNIDTDNGSMTVTIPQDFLNDATYPITHVSGTTVGYTTAGTAGADNWSTDSPGVVINGPHVDSGGGGTISKITAYVGYGNKVAVNCKLGILNYSDYTLVAGDNTGFNLPSSTKAWHDSASISGTITNGASYWIGWKQDGSVKVAYDAGTGFYAKYGTEAYATNWGTETMAGDVSTNRKWSIYVTYTAGGGASGPANLKSLNGNLKSNIKSVNTNLIANCKSYNTNV